MKRRLIVAITGASGVIYGTRALELLRTVRISGLTLVISPSAMRTIVQETTFSVDEVRGLADHHYNYKDVGAAISSGSFRTDGMLVAPCSVGQLSGIAHCFDDELIVGQPMCASRSGAAWCCCFVRPAACGPYRASGAGDPERRDRDASRCRGSTPGPMVSPTS